MSVRDLSAGTIVDERYQILERVGSGGMADVYCAEDLQLGRRVALKLLHRRFAEDREFVERFRREASSAAGLQHANVVGVYDRGEWDGTYYIAMEMLEGSSLKQVINQHAPLEPVTAIDITLQILRAARFAHQRGIVHRDLKPHNVILDAEGRAKVTDFGIARAGASDMTETGSIMGTAQYLSPEQAQGHSVSAVSDLYSIGIILYELLAGRLPFEGDSAVAIAMKQVSEAPVPPSVYNETVPPQLDAIVLRAMEKDPEDRYQSADEFIAALEQVRAGVLAQPPGQNTAVFAAAGLAGAQLAEGDAYAAGVYPAGPLADEEEDARRRRRRNWLLALLALLVIGGAVAAFLLTRPAQVAVPRVVGNSLPVAKTALQNAGFTVQVDRATNAAPVDEVFSQDPSAGARADKGSTVSLTVSNGPGQNQVPSVDGLAEKDAVAALKKAGFKVTVRKEASDSVSAGDAIRTVPDTGTLATRGSIVTLFVSGGPSQVTVPDVTGDSQALAENEITGAGLKVDVSEQESSSQGPGTVLSQSPGSGATVDKGTSVQIVVAKEPRTVSVPDVTGSDSASATQTLSAAGFTVAPKSVPVDTKAKDGKVIDQSPSGGAKAKKGSKVTITVGKYSPSLGGESPPGGGGGGGGGGGTGTGTGTGPSTTTPGGP